MGYINDPTSEVTLALADANAPEEQINFELLGEMRRYLDSPIGEAAMTPANCECGWNDCFPTLESAPDKCPRCGNRFLF